MYDPQTINIIFYYSCCTISFRTQSVHDNAMFTLFNPCIMMRSVTRVTPTNALFYNLCVRSFTLFHYWYQNIVHCCLLYFCMF